METATVSKESEVKEGKEFVNGKPEEFKGASNLVGTNLEAAVKEAVEQIRHCDEQAGLWQNQKQQVMTQMNETLDRIQKQFGEQGGSPRVDVEKKARTRIDKNATVPDLIRTFLEKNGEARTKDIRKFLLAHGRKTSPGVALGRMVKNGSLKHADRGIYKIA